MPQALLPIVPDEATRVSERISVVRAGGQWTYFCGIQPVFQHAEDDRRAFRMFTAQLCCQGACTQAEVIRVFGVSRTVSCGAWQSIARKESRASFDLAGVPLPGC